MDKALNRLDSGVGANADTELSANTAIVVMVNFILVLELSVTLSAEQKNATIIKNIPAVTRREPRNDSKRQIGDLAHRTMTTEKRRCDDVHTVHARRNLHQSWPRLMSHFRKAVQTVEGSKNLGRTIGCL